jgi:hypothetical protein
MGSSSSLILSFVGNNLLEPSRMAEIIHKNLPYAVNDSLGALDLAF